jgi:hypothetical protein
VKTKKAQISSKRETKECSDLFPSSTIQTQTHLSRENKTQIFPNKFKN